MEQVDPTCPKQDRPAKAASEQVARLGSRLKEKGISPVFTLLVYAFDCKHEEKTAYHVNIVSTGAQGITPEGRNTVIVALESVLAEWKKGRE